MRKIKKYLSPSGSLPVWQTPVGEDWRKEWKYRLTPASRSKVAGGWSSKGKVKRASESGELYTKRRIKEETKRTWRSDAADIAHGIGEGALALHPYTAIPYYGAKVGQNVLNGNVNWETALNASVPLFHLAPQAVGLREATNVALEDAANAGSKTARNWRVAREINLTTNDRPKFIRIPSKNLFRTQVYKGGEITDPYSSFVTTDPLYAAHYGKVTPYIFESKSVARAKEPMIGSSDPVTMDMFVYNNTKHNPNATAIMGHDAVTGEFAPSRGIEILNLNPKNLYPIKTSEPSISLKFFERKPSRISLAERLGISKGDRNLPFKQKLPTEHIQGEEAVKMFKEYGGTPIPEGSINGEQLRKYVAEARERYGLVGNNNVTDEEIALALYKHSKELGGNTAAVNALGEPLLLFRGDTRRYTQLKERISPEELAKKSGTMDNSLGNLFLGEFPDSWRGVDRYIGTWRNFDGSPKLVGSGTGSKVVWDGKTASEIEGYPYLGPLAGGGYKLYSQPHRYGNIDVYKLPASMMESGVNDLNAFIVRTPQMRNASSEISVLNDDWMLQGAKDSHFMSKNYKYNPKTYSMENVKTGESLGEITTESAPESRAAMGDHYKELLKEAEQKQLGLLKSEANAPLRDEHSLYSYFALPNFNIQGAKHLLPYDLRIPRNWKDKNIYRGLIPLTTGYTLYDLFNQPQLQYLKQGGKMNILLFLKNGSGIHIKKKNRGKFTDYCGGLVTQECINKGKHSSNPAVRKRATFAANARKWKHLQGGVMRAGDKAKSNLTKRKNPNWNNIDRAYRYFTLDRGLDHNSAVALLGNIIEESRGFHDAFLKNGGGRGLIQWDGLPAPKGLYPQLKSIVDSVIMPANVYDPKTKEVSNYWKSTNGVKGDDVRKNFLNKKVSPTNKATLYAKAYLRPGKPRYKERELSTAQIDSIYNPKIRNILVKRNGGKAFVEGVNVLDSNPKAYKYVKKKYKMRMALEGAKFDWTSTLANVGSSILQEYFLNKKTSKLATASAETAKLNYKLEALSSLEETIKNKRTLRLNILNSIKNTADNPNAFGGVFEDTFIRLGDNEAISEYNQKIKNYNSTIDALLLAQESENTGNFISGIMLLGMGVLNNYLSNKSSLKNAPTTISTKTSYNYFSAPKKFGTFNNDGSMNLGYNMTWSTDKGVQTKNWSDGIFNKSYTDYLK